MRRSWIYKVASFLVQVYSTVRRRGGAARSGGVGFVLFCFAGVCMYLAGEASDGR